MNEVQVFEQKNLAVFKQLQDFKKKQKEMEDQEKKLKKQLEESMSEYGIKSFKNDYITISYVAGSESTSLDVKMLEEKEPSLYKELLADYPKVKTTKPYVKFTVK